MNSKVRCEMVARARRKPTKAKVVAGFILATVLTTSAVAHAFSRNLTGLWTVRNGMNVAIVHNTKTDDATFTFPAALPSFSANHLQFNGSVFGWKELDEGSNANEFMFGGTLEPISFAKGDTICTLEASLNGTGTVLGQSPGRKLRTLCKITPRISCDNGEKRQLSQIDCSGDWQ